MQWSSLEKAVANGVKLQDLDGTIFPGAEQGSTGWKAALKWKM
jgi:hypothetical protein